MEYNNRKIPYERRCEIGERLREFRLSKKMTQDEIAEILEISKTFYGQAERGNCSLGEYRLLLLADRLDADIGYILTGKKYYHVDMLNKLLEIPEEREKNYTANFKIDNRNAVIYMEYNYVKHRYM